MFLLDDGFAERFCARKSELKLWFALRTVNSVVVRPNRISGNST